MALDPLLGTYGQHLTFQTCLEINGYLNHPGSSEIPILNVSALFIILAVIGCCSDECLRA